MRVLVPTKISRSLFTGISLIAALFGLAIPASHAAVVDWGTTGSLLNSTLIPTTGAFTFSNVDGQGFDIVVTTDNLSGGCGMGNFGVPDNSLGYSFWLGGPVSLSNSPTSLVSFQFFQTGTTIPIAMTGVHFSLQDAEEKERFLNFGYYDQSGSLQLLPNTSSVFFGYYDQSGSGQLLPNTSSTIPSTIDTSLASNILENDATYQGGTQLGKVIDVDLSAIPITGFTFDPYRASATNAGSVEMTGLGNLQPLESPVPEPTTALFGLAITGVLMTARRRILQGKVQIQDV